jgi:hypothetical protein
MRGALIVRPHTHLTHMINIALTTEFWLDVNAAV